MPGTPRRRGARSRAGAWRSCVSIRANIRTRSPRCCVPDGYDADRVRQIILDGFDMSLGTGLGKMKGQDLPHRPSRPFQRL